MCQAPPDSEQAVVDVGTVVNTSCPLLVDDTLFGKKTNNNVGIIDRLHYFITDSDDAVFRYELSYWITHHKMEKATTYLKGYSTDVRHE